MEENIEQYLRPHYSLTIYSDIQIQDVSSNYCGAFSVCFVLNAKNDVAYRQFLGHYNCKNLLLNDEILKQDFSKMTFIINLN